ncbi:MAG: exodeoxyribonuclease VII large subunit [Treponema sp.]|jgi:exodeoxyribonuclease VII large subunit|nr:exodeoxyribonuclease VII large subunit [Treponema sp.]
MEALNQRFTDHEKLTVSELTALIRQTLEGNFTSVVVAGELSNCRPSSTGHLYFTLKDAEAAIAGIMFRNRLGSLSFEPKDGMLLRVRGSLSVYAQRGTYSIVAEEMELAGTGEILAMLEERKRRFAAEGLFDEARKKRIPRFPKTIGIVSSPTGAAVRDILNILSRRSGGMRVIILPAPVQGNEAAGIIARRIEQANFWKIADVLIVGRGGGSLEDLLSFSEEAVVRAVAASKIPVISAVGHEIDWALSDFAADLRAPTPSAAAELVSDDRDSTAEKVRSLSRTLIHTIKARMERIMLSLRPFSPEDLEYRFRSILQPTLVRFDDAKEALLQNLNDKVEEIRRRLELANMGLEASSPLKILERGYSVVTIADNGKKAGKLVRSNKDVKKGDRLIIRPLEGLIHAEVNDGKD